MEQGRLVQGKVDFCGLRWASVGEGRFLWGMVGSFGGRQIYMG